MGTFLSEVFDSFSHSDSGESGVVAAAVAAAAAAAVVGPTVRSSEVALDPRPLLLQTQ